MSREFLRAVRDVELRREINRVLLALSTMSDVSAARIGFSSPSADSKQIGPPAHPSGYADFLRAFQRAVETYAKDGKTSPLWKLTFDAEAAYQSQVMPLSKDERMGRVSLTLQRPDEETERKQVIENYEGVNSYKLSLQLNVSEGWLQHIRNQAERDPIWGTPRIAWKGTEEEKRAVVKAMKEGGCTQQETAQSLKVSLRTVANYWRAA